MKKHSAHPFLDNGKYKTCAKFQQKNMELQDSWSLSKFSTFRQNTWFLKNNKALSKFLYGILHYLISVIKL